MAMCPTYFLCLTYSAGMISTVLLLVEADVPLASSNNHYSQQSLFINAPPTFLASCWGGKVMWQGTSNTLETSLSPIKSFKRTSFLLVMLMEVTLSMLWLQMYIYTTTLGIIWCAQILCFNQSYYFLILQTIWQHKSHGKADIFEAWH